MSSPGQWEQVSEFRGKSGAECESFIKSIRKAAWKEGKVRDALWMADFASLHFSGKALKWHSDLSPDVKQDWDKLEKALLERWPPPADESDNEETDAAVIPTPAAASVPSTKVGKSTEIGFMQFVPTSGDREFMYISKPDSSGRCVLTTEVEKALRLGWDRSVDSGSRVLECIGTGSKWLAMQWSSQTLDLEQGSKMWAHLSVVDPNTLTPAAFGSSVNPPALAPFRINVWKLSPEGKITPTSSSRYLRLEFAFISLWIRTRTRKRIQAKPVVA